jgi:hypothetical protein
MSIAPKLNLFEMGTRYDHYQELKEIFADGIQVMKATESKYQSEQDKKRIAKLEHAVEMIETRINVLSNFEESMASHSKLWDAVVRGTREGMIDIKEREAQNGETGTDRRT